MYLVLSVFHLLLRGHLELKYRLYNSGNTSWDISVGMFPVTSTSNKPLQKYSYTRAFCHIILKVCLYFTWWMQNGIVFGQAFCTLLYLFKFMYSRVNLNNSRFFAIHLQTKLIHIPGILWWRNISLFVQYRKPITVQTLMNVSLKSSVTQDSQCMAVLLYITSKSEAAWRSGYRVWFVIGGYLSVMSSSPIKGPRCFLEQETLL